MNGTFYCFPPSPLSFHFEAAADSSVIAHLAERGKSAGSTLAEGNGA